MHFHLIIRRRPSKLNPTQHHLMAQHECIARIKDMIQNPKDASISNQIRVSQIAGFASRSNAQHGNACDPPPFGSNNNKASNCSAVDMFRSSLSFQPTRCRADSTSAVPLDFLHLAAKQINTVAKNANQCTSVMPIAGRKRHFTANESPNNTQSTFPKLTKPKRKLKNKWTASLQELKAYKLEHGDCIVPRGYAANPRLASWVAEQRKQYKLSTDGKQSSISAGRVLLLDQLHFVWNAQQAAWERHLRDLRLFCSEYGHCHVPISKKDYPKLALWVKEQRRHYTLMKQGKQSHMNEVRMQALTSMGFCWDTHEATWLKRLRELVEFKERFGTCIVPSSYMENPKLRTWVHHQRRQYRKFREGGIGCHITTDRIQALKEIGLPLASSSSSFLDSSVSDAGSVCSLDSEKDLDSLDLRPRKRHQVSEI